jgi:NAD(P)-dependent dehydrogenase (short-subunit alcohol dehydrogenase family)
MSCLVDHARGFDARDLDVDLSGRVCLITGGNAGLGRAAARRLAELGAEVRLLCRNPKRGREAERTIRAETGSRSVYFELLDVASLESVRAYASSFAGARIDVLIHNAGVLPDRRILTPDDLEVTLATNVIGPFLLTRLLESKLVGSPSRVIWVASGGMYARRLSTEDADWSSRPFDGIAAYAQTKRMQVVLAEELASLYSQRPIVLHSVHPGWADTPGVRTSLPLFRRIMSWLLRDADEGADTIVWLAAAEKASRGSGTFWFDRRPAPTHLVGATRETPDDRGNLWRLCHDLSGLSDVFDRPREQAV